MILSERKYFNNSSDAPKVPNKGKAKRDGVINQQNNNFNTENLDALKTKTQNQYFSARDRSGELLLSNLATYTASPTGHIQMFCFVESSVRILSYE